MDRTVEGSGIGKVNMRQFGRFLAVLRREKGMTQRELAERVHVTDKAVSKWERGLSLPDSALLLPLAEVLGVTVTELLVGERTKDSDGACDREAEGKGSEGGSTGTEEGYRLSRGEIKKRALFYTAEVLLTILEVATLYLLAGSTRKFSALDISIDVLLVVWMPLFFGLWFFFFIPERLPAYYDREKISCYSRGGFRISLPGLYFNNGNWFRILRCGRLWCGLTPILYPMFYVFLRMLLPDAVWNIVVVRVAVSLAAVLGGLFIPMYRAGGKCRE